MSNNFTVFRKEATKDKERRNPYLRTIVSLINYSKSIEIRKTEELGKILFINN